MSESVEYRTWLKMRERCENPNNKSFGNYGGRGIKVCSRWSDFSAFIQDMGKRPAGCSIDRIDNSKGYEPENCRWASSVQQARNVRSNVLLSIDGVTATIAEWCEKQNSVGYEGIRARLRRGWSDKEAVFGRNQ
jgi:hypothetical protein